jgi:hypothetical protein
MFHFSIITQYILFNVISSIKNSLQVPCYRAKCLCSHSESPQFDHPYKPGFLKSMNYDAPVCAFVSFLLFFPLSQAQTSSIAPFPPDTLRQCFLERDK